MPDDIEIAPFTAADSNAVVGLIVSIQRGEFDLPITIDDQPDLTDVDAGYRTAGGEFFVARARGHVVGTVAAIIVDDNTVALRKMFVHRDHRGAGGLAGRLMDTIVDWSRRAGYRTILLGTTDRMTAAHRFYEKHGFTRIDADRLPAEFPRMAVDSVFFRRELPGVVHIRQYDPRWPQVFDTQRALIAATLAHLAPTIEHMGSTSVPELAAKPIIDIVLSVPDSTDEDAYVPQLTAAGYVFRLREPEWFEHRLLVRDWPRVNLHVYSAGCAEVDTMRRFRDHLRTHSSDRLLYERVKRQLASRNWEIVQDYADAKSDVVSDIMSRAR
jgi:GrpB-like predicted nucleotidyltransferase (UPF0157 family)/GNAT superfamily N-acetyltransferase